MRSLRRVFGKWLLRAALSLVALIALYISSLAFPYPAFAHKARVGEFAVYSTTPLSEDLGRTIDDVRARIAAMENAETGARCRIFICNGRLYSVFASLTRRTSNSMAIGLSAFRNIYVNEPKIRFVAANNPAGIRHSRFEGNLAEVIAHEVAHFNVVRSLGYRASLRIPVWKSEGFAEYQANLAAARADSAYSFVERIDLLRNDAFWGEGLPARELFEWHLLVEFLAGARGFGLNDLLDDTVTEAAAREEMFAWRERQRSPR
jgi:hypothetical protein